MKKDTLSIDGKMYISTRRASEIAGYSKDYVGQLCREGRIESRMVSRSWWVDEASIRRHAAETVKANQTSFRQPHGEVSVLVSRPITYNIALAARIRVDLANLPPLRPFAVVNLAELGNGGFADILRKTLLSLALVVALGATVGAVGYAGTGAASRSAIVANASGAMSALSAVWNGMLAHFGVSSSNSGQLSFANDQGQGSDDLSLPQAGIVVVPSAGSSTDAKLAQSIVNSFSDDVQVAPSADGTSGVITPQFRTVKGHDYLYVLVPVKATSTPATNDERD